MATGAFSSAEILTDADASKNGAKFKLVFATPGGGGWTAPFTVSNNPTLWPVVYCNGTAINDTLNTAGNRVAGVTVETPAALNGSNLEITITLLGYARSGDTVTCDVPAAFITDSGGTNSSGSTTGASVTNSSTKTAGSTLTRQKGLPVVAWAIRDQWPHDGTAQGDVPADRIRVAFDAFDKWNGIDYVEVTFNYVATIVSDSAVTSLGSNVYRITSKRWCDLYGYGLEEDYWYLDVDISAASDGNQGTVSITKVRTYDGVDHDPSSGIGNARAVPAYTLVVRKTKTLRYLDVNAVGAGTGTSWADAYTDLSTCEAGITTTIDEVRCAPGTYTEAGMTFDQSRTGRFVKWVYDGTGPNGAGTVTFAFSGTTNFKAFQAFKNITFAIASNSALRAATTDHLAFESISETSTDITNASPRNYSSCSHFSAVGCNWQGGFRGPTFGRVAGTEGPNVLIHKVTIDNSGTGTSGNFMNCLIEGYKAINCMTDTGFTAGTHADFIHPFETIVLSGAGWTDATKSITKTGGFTNLIADASLMSVNLTAGTGVTTGEYRLNSKTSNDAAVSDTDINSGGGDIADASVAGSIHSCTFENFIIRDCDALDNGESGGRNYNFILLETPGRNLAMYRNVAFSYQSSQQIVQIQGCPRNVQVVHNTFLAIDNDAQTDNRGLTISGTIAPNPYDQQGLLFVNNLTAAMTGSVGGHFSGNTPNLFYRKRYYSGNVTWKQSPVNPIVSAYTALATGNLSSVGLVDTAVSPYDLSPAADSDILGLGTAGFLDRDHAGIEISGSVAPGAYQFDTTGFEWVTDSTDGGGAIAFTDPENAEGEPDELSTSVTLDSGEDGSLDWTWETMEASGPIGGIEYRVYVYDLNPAEVTYTLTPSGGSPLTFTGNGFSTDEYGTYVSLGGRRSNPNHITSATIPTQATLSVENVGGGLIQVAIDGARRLVYPPSGGGRASRTSRESREFRC